MAGKSITFSFKRVPDYRIVLATGAFGGVTPSGLIKMDLFTEYVPPPETVEQEIAEDGSLGTEIRRGPNERHVTRDLQIGVMMTSDSAERIGNWLLQRAKQARERQERRAVKNAEVPRSNE